jgi:hypothetical protein
LRQSAAPVSATLELVMSGDETPPRDRAEAKPLNDNDTSTPARRSYHHT